MRSSRTRRGTLGRRHSLLVEAPETAEPAGSAQTSSSGNGCLLVRGPLAGLKPTTALASAVANDRTCARDYLVLSCSAAPGALLRIDSMPSIPVRCATTARFCSMRSSGPPESRSPSRPFRTSRCCYSCIGESAPKRNTASCSTARVFACTISRQPLQIRPNIRALTTSVFGSFGAQ